MNSSSQTSKQEPPKWVKDVTPIGVTLLAGTLLAIFYPAFALKALIFIATLGVLVFVHEWGHYQFALWGGMKVNRFGVGFPPWIFTVRRNNVDYSIGALPIGGMVDIAGLGSEEEMVHTASGGEVPANHRNPDAKHGEKNFQDASLWWRFLALFAGPLMNFLLAIVIFMAVYSTVGIQKVFMPPIVESVRAGSPALAAGFKSGDKIVSIDGKKTPDPTSIVNSFKQTGLKPVTVTVQRGNSTVPIRITPVMKDLGTPSKPSVRPYIGVNFSTKNPTITYEKVSPLQAVKQGFSDSMFISRLILDFLRRAVSGGVSSEEWEGVGGPVKIAQTVGQASEHGMASVLLFAASLSVNLGLMNLLPFPALDGGRILFLGYELVMRRPVNPRIEGVVHMVGMIMLLTFMLLITLKDVASLPAVKALKNLLG